MGAVDPGLQACSLETTGEAVAFEVRLRGELQDHDLAWPGAVLLMVQLEALPADLEAGRELVLLAGPIGLHEPWKREQDEKAENPDDDQDLGKRHA